MDDIDPSRGIEDMSRNDAVETAGEIAEIDAGSTISCLIFKLCGSLCSGMSMREADMGNGPGPRLNGPTVEVIVVVVVVGAEDAIE